MTVYDELKGYLEELTRKHNLGRDSILVRCSALTAEQAIGKPDRDDYPIIRGREVMVEAEFRGAKGQAFTDAYGTGDFTVSDLLDLDLSTTRNRACFVSGLNAVMRYFGLCEQTVHCRDQEPKTCAGKLKEIIPSGNRVLLVGNQPGFLAALAPLYAVRVVDLDEDTIGEKVAGVTVEPPENTARAIADSDIILVTGSTLVNGTIGDFLTVEKPVIFFGVTIAGPAKILNLKRYCQCGH